jgi:hypothetical protein
VLRKGPLVVYGADNGISKAFRCEGLVWWKGLVACHPSRWLCVLPPLLCALLPALTPTPTQPTQPNQPNTRNLPGVEVSSVDSLNLLQLAPGGHLGRFVIFTQSAFDRLDKIYGEGG